MVVLSACYLQGPKEKSITLIFAFNVSTKTIKRFVDNSHTRFENKQKSLPFFETLNKKSLIPFRIPLN